MPALCKHSYGQNSDASCSTDKIPTGKVEKYQR